MHSCSVSSFPSRHKDYIAQVHPFLNLECRDRGIESSTDPHRVHAEVKELTSLRENQTWEEVDRNVRLKLNIEQI